MSCLNVYALSIGSYFVDKSWPSVQVQAFSTGPVHVSLAIYLMDAATLHGSTGPGSCSAPLSPDFLALVKHKVSPPSNCSGEGIWYVKPLCNVTGSDSCILVNWVSWGVMAISPILEPGKYMFWSNSITGQLPLTDPSDITCWSEFPHPQKGSWLCGCMLFSTSRLSPFTLYQRAQKLCASPTLRSALSFIFTSTQFKIFWGILLPF